MENDNTIELAEVEVTRLITAMHYSLNYSDILKIFLKSSLQLKTLEETEYFLNLNKSDA